VAEEKKEAFLSRWSRLKQEKPPEQKAETPAPVLPPVDKLTPESDFKDFMHPKVEDALRRLALKKLFSDPRFNIPDPFEAYSGDWTGGEPIPPEMLATLEQMKAMLKQEPEPQAPAEEKAEEKTEPDEPGRKDA
jgi:uncharacterized protein DUF3306